MLRASMKAFCSCWLILGVGIYAYASLVGTSHATPISIANPSFEKDKSGETAPLGWTIFGEGGISIAQLDKNLYTAPVAGLDGHNVCSWSGAGSGGIRQVLTARLLADTTYKLSMATGTRPGTAPFGGYRVELSTVSGVPILSWDGVGRNPAPIGQFTMTSRSVTTGSQPSGLGERLQISISRPPGHDGGYLDIDDIRLTAVPDRVSHERGPIDVFLVAGQSNAHSWGVDAAQLSKGNRHYAEAPSTLALLAYMQKNRPDPLYSIGSPAHLSIQGAGFGNCDGFGPELSAGTDLAESLKKPIALLKYTVGTAGLITNFRKEGPADPNPANHLYEPMIEFFKTSIQQLREQGYTPRVRALFWLQGESDSGDVRSAMGYAKAISLFISDLRGDLEAPEMKVFLTGLNANTVALGTRPDVIAVFNQGMADIHQSDASVYYISVDDIKTGFADDIHYSADQSIDIGQRWARAYLATQVNTVQP